MKSLAIAICSIWLIFPGQVHAQPSQIVPTRPSLTVLRPAGLFPFRAKRTKEEKRRLLPHAKDLEEYAEFLERSGTGIFRLMPDLGCQESRNLLRADETCVNSIPESSYYSFRKRDYTIETLSDIRLKNGFLITDGVLSQGILVRLGEVDLESVTVGTEGLGFLNSFSPPVLSVEAKKQYGQIARGVKIGGRHYRNVLPAEENATYALRVVAYKGSIYRNFRGFRYDLLGRDKRVDLTVAFRIVRKDTDGSVTIVWKELDRRKAPRMTFPKKKP